MPQQEKHLDNYNTIQSSPITSHSSIRFYNLVSKFGRFLVRMDPCQDFLFKFADVANDGWKKASALLWLFTHRLDSNLFQLSSLGNTLLVSQHPREFLPSEPICHPVKHIHSSRLRWLTAPLTAAKSVQREIIISLCSTVNETLEVGKEEVDGSDLSLCTCLCLSL